MDEPRPAAPSTPATAEPWWRWWWLWPPVAVGAILRLYRLPSQLLLLDELHAPRAAQAMELGEILTTYPPADNSMPLTAFYELLMENGVALSEPLMRLPGLLAGLLALVVIPVALAHRLGRRAGLWSGWLVAISPGLILYSRIARSYMPMVLLSFLAVMAFERWWRLRRFRSAMAYVGFGAAAVWFHLGAAPFVAAPFVWGGLAALGRASRWRDLGALLALGVGMLAGWATFLVPSWGSFLALFTTKSGFESPSASEWREVLALQAGATEPWAVALFWGLALLGFALLMRRRPALAWLLLVPVLLNLAVLVVTQPLGWASPLVLNRYLLVGLPLLLAGAGVGLAWLADRAPTLQGWPRLVAGASLALVLPLLVLGGPWTDPRVHYSSFLHDDSFVRFSRPPPRMVESASVPEFYLRLAAATDDQPVLEYTALPTWLSQVVLATYQDVHRQRVLLAPQEKILFEDFAPRNYVEPGPAHFLASPARWLIVHRRHAWEMDRVLTAGVIRVPPPLRPISQRTARRLGGYLGRQWGPADYQDPLLQAWDLERVRAAASGASTRSGLLPQAPLPGVQAPAGCWRAAKRARAFAARASRVCAGA